MRSAVSLRRRRWFAAAVEVVEDGDAGGLNVGAVVEESPGDGNVAAEGDPASVTRESHVAADRSKRTRGDSRRRRVVCDGDVTRRRWSRAPMSMACRGRIVGNGEDSRQWSASGDLFSPQPFCPFFFFFFFFFFFKIFSDGCRGRVAGNKEMPPPAVISAPMSMAVADVLSVMEMPPPAVSRNFFFFFLKKKRSCRCCRRRPRESLCR